MSAFDFYAFVNSAILKAYPDMQFRTMKGLGAIPSLCKSEAKQKILSFLIVSMYTYFSEGINKSFDSWHKDVCNEISEIFKAETGIDLPFGKAQKLVSISFKYAYCLDDADKYLRKFYPCHMALDSVVLKWYTENKTDTVGVSNWSSIKYSDYIRIQNNIRQLCDEQNTLPLVKEFDVWLENM